MAVELTAVHIPTPQRKPAKKARSKAGWLLLIALYSYLLWLMLEITLQYIPIDSGAAFLAIKQDYVGMLHYRIAFFVHVFSSIFVLAAGYTQFSKRILARHRQLHRKLGWFYVLVTVCLAGPSGFVIGLYANGGLSSRIAFCTLAVLWVLFTILATVSAIRRQIQAHRRWMLRSFALALSALTLRAWKYVLVLALHPKPMDVYRVVAWLGWVANLLAVEVYIYYKFREVKEVKK
ncbi:MAG: DUF2306 domain-containing protein [Candidatus Sericytochromatia bacterium]